MTGVRVTSGLLAVTAILIASFFLAPAGLAGGDFGAVGDGRLIEAAFSDHLVASWNSANRAMTPELTDLVDYWFRYHAIKSVIAVLLLAVLGAQAISAWRAYAGVGGSGARRTIDLVRATTTTTLGLFALMLVMVNIQATVAPLTALLQALPAADSAETARAFGEIERALADTVQRPPLLHALVDSFGSYHAVMAVEASLVAGGFIVFGGWAWRRCTAESVTVDSTGRGLMRVFAAISGLLAIGLFVAAAVSTRLSLFPLEGLQPYFCPANL
jgi:hypothetical protein